MPIGLCAALGYAAVFGSATNTLLAPILIGCEVFGFGDLPKFFIVCVVAYLFNMDKSIYALQSGRRWMSKQVVSTGNGVLAMQSARTLFLVRALKPEQPLLTVEATGISVKRAVGRDHAMARHDNRNGITRDRGPHGTGRHNGCFVSRCTMSSRNTLGDLTIRSDLATRDRKQLKPNLALKRRTNHMQRRRKPRLLPRKISIQPSPRTLKHRRCRAICRTHRRHAANTGNRVGAFNMFGVFPEKRGAKMFLPLKPKPRQTAAISGKQDFAQRRGKRRRDHQRLLSKLRTIIPRIVQTTPQIRLGGLAIA